MAHRPARRGFTLIEIMMTVAIIGVLASIALPEFRNYTLRAKAAERMNMMVRIKQTLQDYYVRNGVAAPGGAGLDSGWNPAWPPTANKRPMAIDIPNWNIYFSGSARSGLPTEGGVYYSYRFVIDEAASPPTITVYAAGDLDGDTIVSQKQLVYTRSVGTFLQAGEFPPLGQDDIAGPYGTF